MANLNGLLDVETLTVEAWRDPVVEALGHDPRSLYVELFWLPVLGPSTTWLLRRLAGHLEETPGGCTLSIAETSRALGLGERSGRNGPFMRTLRRTVDFDMVRPGRPGAIEARRALPPLARRHLARLSEPLRRAHDAYEARAVAAAHPSVEQARRRGRQLALSLIDLGEEPPAAEHQLIAWRLHPGLARECVHWAVAARSEPAEVEADVVTLAGGGRRARPALVHEAGG
jgi:hypothetical protein